MLLERDLREIGRFVDGGLANVGAGQPLASPLPAGYPVPRENVPTDAVGVDASTGDPSVRRPAVAVRTANFPLPIAQINGAQFESDNAVLEQDFHVVSAGLVRIDVLILQSGVNSILDMTVTGQQDDSGWGQINGGTALTAGVWYHDERELQPGDLLNLRFETSTTATIRASFVEGA